MASPVHDNLSDKKNHNSVSEMSSVSNSNMKTGDVVLPDHDGKYNDFDEAKSNNHFIKNQKKFYRPEYQLVHLKQYLGTSIFSLTDTEDINTMDVNADDIWVVSYPRSGTTLTQEIVYLISSNLDLETALSESLDVRFPFLDVMDPRFPEFSGIKLIKKMPTPRRIKSHLHFHTMPLGVQEKKCKIIYVARNPKDVIMSLYFFTRHLRANKPELTVEEFLQAFLADTTYASPWWLHVKDYWKQRNYENVLFLFYEDLIKNMKENIYKIGKFMGKELLPDEISKIAEHCSLKNMKNNAAVNGIWELPTGEHIRKGKIGSWKEHFTSEMSSDVERMVEDKLGDTDLAFVYEDNDQ